MDDLLAIAYRETVAASSVPPGTEKAPAELDLKSWHTFVVCLWGMEFPFGQGKEEVHAKNEKWWLTCMFGGGTACFPAVH